MTRALNVVAITCLGVLALGVAPAFGAFPGANGRIAFDSDRDAPGEQLDVFTMRSDGTAS